MAGAYRMAQSGSKLVITDPDGNQLAEHANVTVTVRDGVARAKVGATQVAEMPAASLESPRRKTYRITGPDGTVWVASKPCGCTSG